MFSWFQTSLSIYLLCHYNHALNWMMSSWMIKSYQWDFILSDVLSFRILDHWACPHWFLQPLSPSWSLIISSFHRLLNTKCIIHILKEDNIFNCPSISICYLLQKHLPGIMNYWLTQRANIWKKVLSLVFMYYRGSPLAEKGQKNLQK